ncbi:MAG: SRPBCC family protein [Acidimicrobiales bacterium]|jgi:hypothetical protein
MRRLSVAAAGTTCADAGLVWSLVADANRYAGWGPWEDGGYRPPSLGPSRKGMVQWFRYNRRTTTTEEILEVEEARRLVYTVVGGLPVKNYRAEVTLAPASPAGTSVNWAATWDDTVMGRLVRRRLQQVYYRVVAALVAAADQEASSQSR